MALITCPECGKEISSTTSACPHCGYTLKKQKPPQVLIAVIAVVAIIIVVAVVLLLNNRKTDNTEINFSLGPHNVGNTNNNKNDTEKVSTTDNPLAFGETITVHTSCDAGIAAETVDMYTCEITPLSYEIIDENCLLVQMRVNLLSFDYDTEQTISVRDLIGSITDVINRDGSSNNIACWVFNDYDEALTNSSGGGTKIRQGSDGIYWVRYSENPSPDLLQIVAKTYISWNSYDYVYNYYKFK